MQIHGLNYIPIPKNDNSFFAAFNASKILTAVTDIPTLRSIIARYIEMHLSDYKVGLYGNPAELMTHVCQFKYFDLKHSTHQNLSVGAIHIQALAETLSKTIMVIAMREHTTTPHIECMHGERYLTMREPIFVYREGAHYSGMQLAPGHSVQSIIDALKHPSIAAGDQKTAQMI